MGGNRLRSVPAGIAAVLVLGLAGSAAAQVDNGTEAPAARVPAPATQPDVAQAAPAEPLVGQAAGPGREMPAAQANGPAPAQQPGGLAAATQPEGLPRVLRDLSTQGIVEQVQPVEPLTPGQLEQLRGADIRVTPVGPNEIIIEAEDEETLNAVEALIRRMEEGAPPPDVVVIQLKNAQAAQLAPQLNMMFQQLLPPGRTPRADERVTVVAEPRSNSLIVAASSSRLLQVQDLIEKLDAKPMIGQVEVNTFLLKHIQASEAATMLQDLLRKLQQQRGVPGDTFTITPDDRTNTLIITAPTGDLPQIKSLIGTIDVPPAFATAEMMIYSLKNVAATDLATVLGEMISAQITRAGGAGPARPGGAGGGAETIRRLKLRTAEGRELPELNLEKPIKIIPEPGTNSVVVSSTPENLQAMGDIVKLLDNYPISEGVRVWVFPLQYADANQLATMLKTAFDTNRNVGLRVPPQGATLKVIPAVPETAGGQAFMFSAAVMADARTNTLLVAGRQQVLELAEEIVKKLDRPGILSKWPIHIVKLDNNDAPTVAPLLEKLFQQQAAQGQGVTTERVMITSDVATNALIIGASDENFKILQRLIAELDTAPDVEFLVREFPLQNADATQVADAIKNLVSQGIFKQGGLAGPPGDKAAKLTVVPETRTNTVIVSAKKEYWPLIENLIQRMDSPEAPFPLAGNFTIVPLKNTDAVRTAGVLQDLLDQIAKAGQAAGRKVTQPPPVIIPDPATNSLLVSGSGGTLEQVRTLVSQLDVPTTTPTAEVRVYTLQQASPEQLEAIITDLFQVRGGGAGGAGVGGAPGGGAGARAATPMQIYSDAGSNSLIVRASVEDHQRIASLVEQLDVPNLTATQVKLFPLEKAQAATVVQVLQSLYQMRTTGGAGQQPFGGAGVGGGARTGSATGVTFTADDRSNSVVVRAAPADMRNIEDLIRRLDTAEVQTEMGLRWVQLKRADATEMAQMLMDFLQGQGTTGRSGVTGGFGGGGFGGGGGANAQRAMLINFRQQGPQGQEVLRRLLRQDIRITPDVRTNTLIVMAPPDSVEVLVALIESLDNIAPVTVEIEIFQLQNADATETVDTLEQLFGLGQGGTTGGTGTARGGRTAQEQRNLMLAQQGFGGFGGLGGVNGLPAGGLPGGVAPGAAMTPGAMPGLGGGIAGGVAGALGVAGPTTAGGRPILSLTPDVRTNSVIAAGSPEYLAMTRQLVEQLDGQEMQARTQKVIDVKYVPATQMATALREFYNEEATRLDKLQEEIPAQRRIEQEVSVVQAEDSNKILLSVSPRYESQVMELINRLDVQPPQVMIQALLAEVTLDTRLEWGFEFAYQDLYFSRTGQDYNTVVGTSLGAAGTGGGFTFTLTGEDFSLLMRTLQTESKVQVLQRPQILVLDNTEAYIQVGERVPFVANYTVNQLGQVQTTVDREDVGVILKVTPHITPDDFVRMDVTPEISALSESTVQISENLNAPVITRRVAATSVTVKNGETVVIGGLIRTAKGQTERKVPLAGDIPILGYLFKSQTNTNTRTELLIVLTPRIVRTVEDARELSVEQRDVGGLIPYETKRSPLWQGLQVVTPPVPEAPCPGEPIRAPVTQPVYGPQPPMYGPRPPSARTEEAPGPVEPVGYLEQRR